MRSWAKKAWAFFVLFALLVSAIPPLGVAAAEHTWDGTVNFTVQNGDTINVANGATGTLNVPADASITIDGAITNATVGLTLNINSGAEVTWNAVFTGNVTNNTPANNYLINVTGGGTLDIGSTGSSATIQNDGKGGAILLNSAATLNVYGTVASGGTASSNANVTGNAVRIASAGAAVHVNENGLIESRDGNSNTALYIENDVQGAIVQINGGTVRSVGAGYAICDGTPFTDGVTYANNNTQITLKSGEISAGSACAIRSSGTGSSVEVKGGSVSNAAGNNANPAIYMSASSGGGVSSPANNNIIISGGKVESTSLAGYAIQTAGSVSVSGGEVLAGGVGGGSGRAINLVGTYSQATVSESGKVHTSGTGAAISTATTNPETVTNASVVVNGGEVSSVGGNAINVTGASSTVTVSGGIVSATGSNHTINASGANTAININGGEVSATTANAINTITAASHATINVGGSNPTTKVHSDTGRAIQTLGSNTTITIDGDCQVYVFTEGNAIRSGGASGTVTLKRGFVFAYGRSNADNVIKTADNDVLIENDDPQETLVVVWNQAAGKTTYKERAYGYYADLNNAYNGTPKDSYWTQDDSIAGIGYGISTLSGFFPVDGVHIIDDCGLIFTASASTLFMDIAPGNIEPYGKRVPADAADWNWSTSGSNLNLSNFSWNPGVVMPLEIREDATITLHDGYTSAFTSCYLGTGTSYGVFSANDITINGNGTLYAAGGMEWDDWDPYTDNASIGLKAATLTIASDTVTLNAVGGSADDHTVGIKATAVILEKGTLIATGGNAFYDGDSYGIDTPSFTMDGGTLIASGETGAFNSEPTTTRLPDNYIYWRNSDPIHPTGSAGIIVLKDDPDSGPPYEYLASDKYVKIITITNTTEYAYATIGNDQVRGTQFAALNDTPAQTAIITLHGDTTIAQTDIPANTWFRSGIIPQGVAVIANTTSSNTITLTFSDVPLEMSTAIFDIVIPESFMQNRSTPLLVEYNPNARFDIGEPLLYNLDVNVLPASSGTVAGTGAGAYLVGSQVILIAEPATASPPGYHFDRWTFDGITANDLYIGDENSSAILFFMPAKAVTVTAVFEPNPPSTYTLNVIAEAGGAVSGDGNDAYTAGKPIRVTAEPEDGFHFIGWQIGVANRTDAPLDIDNVDTTSSIISFTMPPNAVTLIAMFEEDPLPPDPDPDDPVPPPIYYPLTVTANEGGWVPGILERSFYLPGEAIRLTAVPDDAYHFDGWETDDLELSAEDKASALLAFDMPANPVTITAKFVKNPDNTYSLTVMAGAGGTVSGSASGPYKAGAAISVTAVPEDGFYFAGWDISEDIEEFELDMRDNPARFAMPPANVTLTAIFAPTPAGVYTLTVIAEKGGSVDGTQSGVYAKDYHVSVVPIAAPRYRFNRWRVDTEASSISVANRANPAEFDMPDSAVTLTARFNRPDSDSSSSGADEPMEDMDILVADPGPAAAPKDSGPIPKTSDAGMGHWGLLFGISLLGLFALKFWGMMKER